MSPRSLAFAVALALTTATAFAAEEPAKVPSMQEILDASPKTDWRTLDVTVVPGITAMLAVAARVGAALQLRAVVAAHDGDAGEAAHPAAEHDVVAHLA